MTDLPPNRRIGWIGLGSIGTAMVRRLRAAGEDVTVYARGAGLGDAIAAGCASANDYAALAAASDVLILCVYKDAQLAETLFDRGALAALRPGSVVVIHTTGSPATTQDIARRAPEGVAVLDACFSGGTDDIAAARLTLMAGGDAAALAKVEPVLRHYASRIHHVGPAGYGQMLKLLNNLVFATNLMNAAELMALAERQGFDPATVAHVVGDGSGASYALGLFARPAPPASILAATRPYLEKDVATALDTAREAGLDMTPFAATAHYFRPDQGK